MTSMQPVKEYLARAPSNPGGCSRKNALEAARRSDKEFKENRARSLLHGILILVTVGGITLTSLISILIECSLGQYRNRPITWNEYNLRILRFLGSKVKGYIYI